MAMWRRRAQPAPAEDGPLRVFISYARKDLAAAAKPLRERLREAEIDAFLDIHDIKPGEPWRERLSALIARAEKIVFLISPDSVASEICEWEVDEAERQGKGVLPLVVRETPMDAVPGRLTRLNLIFARTETERAASDAALIEALKTDLAWERERTRINDLAETWRADQSSRRRLPLSDDAVRVMERWRDGHPQAAPAPTELQLGFISAARRELTRRQTRARIGLGAVAAVTTALAVAAFLQSFAAQREAARADANAETARTNETEALAQRDAALTTQSRFLADLAEQAVAEGDGATAALYALEALPAPDRARPYVVEAERAAYAARLSQRETAVIPSFFGHIAPEHFLENGDALLQELPLGQQKTWNVEDGALLSSRDQHGLLVPGLRINDGRMARLSWSDDGAARITVGEEETPRISAPLRDGAGPHRLAFAAGLALALYTEGAALLWDVGSGERIAEIDGLSGFLSSVVISPDGAAIAAVDALSDQASLWNVSSGEKIAVLEAPGASVENFAFSPDGARLVSWSENDDVALLWDGRTGQLRARLEGGRGILTKAVFGDAGAVVVTAHFDGAARIWSAQSGELVHTQLGHSRSVTDIAVCSVEGASEDDGRLRIATTSADATARVWSLGQDEEPLVLSGHEDAVVGAAFAPGCGTLATTSLDGTTRIWSIDRPVAVRALASVDNNRRPVFSRETNRVAVAALEDGAWSVIEIWDPWRAAPETAIKNAYSLGGLSHARFSPSGDRITGLIPGSLAVWDAATGQMTRSFDFGDHLIFAAAFDPAGAQLLTAVRNRGAELWDLESGARRLHLPHDDADVVAAAFSLQGRRLATLTTGERTLRIWDAADGALLASVAEVQGLPTPEAFSPDGTSLITVAGGAPQKVTVDTGVVQQARLASDETVLHFAFGPRGETILGAGVDGGVYLWDAETFEARLALTPERDPLTSGAGFAPRAVFSADGARIVSAAPDDTARIWDVATGLEIARLEGHAEPISGLDIAADGSLLVTTSRFERTTRAWSIYPNTAELVAGLRATAHRCLTPAQRAEAFLSAAPPRWCVTGPDAEGDSPEEWRPLWPYDTRDWRLWQEAKDRGEAPPTPAAQQD